MRISSITKNAGKACNNRLYRHIRTFEKIVKNYFVISMKSFVCSLCHNGILGGGLYLDSQSLTYKTNKLTVDKKYRNLVLPMQEIKEISWKWIVFPIATVNMKNGELYKFIIFNKSRFAKWFQEYSR